MTYYTPTERKYAAKNRSFFTTAGLGEHDLSLPGGRYIPARQIPYSLACITLSFVILGGMYFSSDYSNQIDSVDALQTQTPISSVVTTGPEFIQPDSGFAVRVQRDQFYLAATIWGEARNQGPEGMRAVADVIVNRIGHYGDTIRAVVLAKRQFSCWNKTDPNRALLTPWHLAHLHGDDAESWYQAQRIARQEITGIASDTTHGAMHYHERHIHPYWVTKVIAKIGSHLFYR